MNTKDLLKEEEKRALNSISLIASENIASKDVRMALSSILTNKYAEGYPNKRYYSGCEVADKIELHCIDLVKKIFDASWANVQPHSGSQANQAVFFALLQPGDTILSLSLKAGGHLTHGASVSSVHQNYKIVHYTLDETGLINMDEVKKLAIEHKPKMIITGASGYPGVFDWKKFKEIADLNNSYLLADIAHIAGLIAGGEHENPIAYCDVMTSTTHKTLRGPRGGIIISNNLELGKKIDKALFPGIQGGPLMHAIAAKAIAFEEILQPEFKTYIKKVMENAQILANTIIKAGGKLISNGTKNHLMILDCRSFEMDAKTTEKLLLEANLSISTCALIDDTSWITPNGIRFGTPYISNFEFDMQEFSNKFVECLKSKDATVLKKFVQCIPKQTF